ncbi:LytR/AlgR family response regulator transcription factor [Ekhidna sp.]|uniref:LytR/AlgR family response regulator transcription factor n=1 Tax=Ekhidna sp. TaxID=2608089 RepID=UPI003C7D5239
MSARILIVEDEPLIAQDLKFLLHDVGIKAVHIAMSYDEAINSLKNSSFDLALLDVNLSGEKDGIHLAEHLNVSLIPFIFITSYFNSSVIERAKRTKPQAYLVKPFQAKDVKVNVQMALFKASESNSENPVFVKEKNGSIKVDLDKLLYLEAVDNYTRLIFENEEVMVSQNLKSMQEKLDSKEIIRVHKSFCVNIGAISTIKGGALFINDHKIPIGRAYKHDFTDRISFL